MRFFPSSFALPRTALTRVDHFVFPPFAFTHPPTYIIIFQMQFVYLTSWHTGELRSIEETEMT